MNLYLPAGPAGGRTGWRRARNRLLRRLGPSWRASPVRRAVQLLALLLFLYLFYYVSWPYAAAFGSRVIAGKEWLPAESFLWLDPVGGFAAALASRAWNVAVLGGAAVLLLAILFPRSFCSWLCPLGTLVDGFDGLIGRRIRRGRPDGAGRWRGVRFGVLAAVGGGAAAGVFLAGFLAPIPVLTRGMLYTGGRLELGTLKNWSMPHPAGWELWLSVALFAAVFLVGLFGARFWCRCLCPGGAMLSLAAPLRLFERRVDDGACIRCGKCAEACDFGAVDAAFGTRPLDCTFCQTCAGACPVNCIRFGRRGAKEVAEPPGAEAKAPVATRRVVLASGLAGVAAAVAVRAAPGPRPVPIRPPGSVPEGAFLDRCVRCGHCVQVCPGPVLRLAGLEAGLEGLWTPVAVMTHAGCHPDCNFCTQVCPTGAIRPLTPEAKRKAVMGVAVVDPSRCLPHRGERDCRLCADECDAAGYHAIEMRRIRLPMGELPPGVFSPEEAEEMARIDAPHVKAEACTGCGLCEYRCHAALVRQQKLLPVRAVTVVAQGPRSR